jgi:hypothetical protein
MNDALHPNSMLRARLLRARFPVLHSVGLAALIFATSSAGLAQEDTSNRDERRRRADNGNDRGNFNPQDMQARMLSSLRERLGVTNDDEWAVISDRVMKVVEARRNSGGGFGGFMFGGRGGAGGSDTSRGGDNTRGNFRGRGSSNPDVAALQSAVTDNMPDAEIKARLDRVREVRKENEAKLTKAQEELRAVLSVRQEAMLVLAGLLP